MAQQEGKRGLTRRDVLRGSAVAGATAAVAVTGGGPVAHAAAGTDRTGASERLVLVNGKIHTFDSENRIVSSVAMEDGRFTHVGRGAHAEGPGTKIINLKGRTVVPGIIDGHNHIVLVGNRPGHHVLVEHVFTIPEALGVYAEFAEGVPAAEWITTIGPIAARQFVEQRLPNLAELDTAVPHNPVFILAGQGGSQTNSAGRTLLLAEGVTVNEDGSIPGGASGSGLALQRLREQLLTPETRRRTALDALQYFTTLGITTHRDSGAFHSDTPSTGIATENTFTMHNPFIELDRDGLLPARLRFDFVHQDGSTNPGAPPPPAIPTLSERLKNTFPFYGNDWLRTGGIGEHTGAGVLGLRAIAAAGWRAEDHSLNLTTATQHIENRELVHAEIPITDLRWVLSHIPQFTEELANRFHAMGGGVLVGWGPLRTGSNVGPPYRMLFDHPIEVGYHSDGGDISLINPWLHFYTMTTGRNLIGDHILGDQILTRWEALWLATVANKWFINEDDVGSIEVGNHADIAVLNKDYFTVPDEEIRTIRSSLTVIGGRIVHDEFGMR